MRPLPQAPSNDLFDRSVARLGIQASLSNEWGWAIARVAVIGATALGALLFLRQSTAFAFLLALLAFALLYDAFLIVLLLKRKVHFAFVAGFILDNGGMLAGWWTVARAQAGLMDANDLYLILFPVLGIGAARLGWIAGAIYTAFWLAWMAWATLHFSPPGHYAVQQLPIRILFMAIASALSLRLVSRLTQERRNSEEATTRYRTLYESLSDAVLLTTPTGRIVDANQGAASLLKVGAAALRGRLLEEIAVPEHRPAFAQAFQRALAGEELLMEIDLSAIPQAIVTVELRGSFVHLGNGRLFHGVGRDITDRKRAEAAVRASEQGLAEAQHVAHLGSWEFHFRSGTMTWTEELARLCGVTLDEGDVTYEAFLTNVPPDDREMIDQIVDQARQDMQPFAFDFRVILEDGLVRWLQGRGEVAIDEDGQPVGIHGTTQDITERKLAEEQSRRQIQQLTVMRTVDTAITGSVDLRLTLDVLLEQVMAQLRVDSAAVLLYNPHTLTLEYAAGRGFRSDAITHSRLLIGQGQAGLAALERRTVSIPDLSKASGELARAQLLANEAFRAYHAVPLIAKGQVRGVLELYHRSHFDPYPGWLDFLETLARQTAIAVDNATLFGDLQRSNAELILAYDTTLEGWARALELRDAETEGHSQRVVRMTVELAKAIGITGADLVHIRRGALLHDIGKMGVPDSILLKPGPLRDEEWEIMRKHPVYAYEMLSPIAFLRPTLDIPYAHHEKWDGTGYPRGLKGEQIPLAARAFAVVDVWDALCSDRPYRAAWPEERVRAYMLEQAGLHFDPQVLAEFLRLDAVTERAAGTASR